MFRDTFKAQYTTIPMAIHRTNRNHGAGEVITHHHRELEIILLTRGTADFFVYTQCHSMQAGDILIIPPYALHRGRTSDTEPTSYYCICFDVDLLCDTELKRSLDSARAHCLTHTDPNAQRLQQYVTDAFFACKEKAEGWELDAVGSLSLLFGYLKRNGVFSPVSKRKKDADFGTRAMTYIVESYATDITSRDAANSLYMNESSFCRAFKATFGCCFSQYLLAYRLEKAKLCLASSEQSVTDIAFRVGFNDCSYFCKVFHRSVGATPLAYRKRVRKAADTSAKGV